MTRAPNFVALSLIVVSAFAGVACNFGDGPKPGSEWKQVSTSVWRHSSNKVEVVRTDTGFLGVPLLPGGQRYYRTAQEYSTFDEAANGVLRNFAAYESAANEMVEIGRNAGLANPAQNKNAGNESDKTLPPTSWTYVKGDKTSTRQQWNSKSGDYALTKDHQGYKLFRRKDGQLVPAGEPETVYRSRDAAARAALADWKSRGHAVDVNTPDDRAERRDAGDDPDGSRISDNEKRTPKTSTQPSKPTSTKPQKAK